MVGARVDVDDPGAPGVDVLRPGEAAEGPRSDRGDVRRAGGGAGSAPGAFNEDDRRPGRVLVLHGHLATARQGVLAHLQPPAGRQHRTVDVKGFLGGSFDEEGLVAGVAGAGRRAGHRARRGGRAGGREGRVGRSLGPHRRLRDVDDDGRDLRCRCHEDDNRRGGGAGAAGQHQTGGQRHCRTSRARDPTLVRHRAPPRQHRSSAARFPSERAPLDRAVSRDHLRSIAGRCNGQMPAPAAKAVGLAEARRLRTSAPSGRQPPRRRTGPGSCPYRSWHRREWCPGRRRWPRWARRP